MLMMMTILTALITFLPILISVAFLTLTERKVLSLIGLRYGPNKVSYQGLLQPISDALKLASKQINYLSWSYSPFYYISASIMFLNSLIIWFCLFYPSSWSFKFSLIIFLFILGLNALGLIVSGWSTFGKYSLIGSLRSMAQLISYEACLYLCVFFFLNYYFLFKLCVMKELLFWPFLIPIVLLIWSPSILAELNRTPYDFSEGESELVSGFNVDFGSLGFTLIFLSEYSNICMFSLMTSFIFFSKFFLFFFVILFVFIIWIRSVLPRYRFDKLMEMCWKIFIPLLTTYFIAVTVFCV